MICAVSAIGTGLVTSYGAVASVYRMQPRRRGKRSRRHTIAIDAQRRQPKVKHRANGVSGNDDWMAVERS